MVDSKKAFVLMPFSEPYSSYYTDIYEPALNALGYEVNKADALRASRPIMEDIQRFILEADIILCEMSGRNENVFYELGLAHAIGKPAILISNDEEALPFDLQHIRTLRYDIRGTKWAEILRDDIQKATKQMESYGPDDVWPPPLIMEIAGANKKDKLDEIGIITAKPIFLDRVQKGDIESVKAFLKAGIPVDSSNDQEQTALMLSSHLEDTQITQLFINANAEVNARDEQGRTALMFANNRGIIQLLLDNGADIDAKNNNGATALILAAWTGGEEALRALMDNGTNVNAKDNSGYTALMAATHDIRAEAVQILLDGGAYLNARNYDGETAFELASKIEKRRGRGRSDISQILKKAGATK